MLESAMKHDREMEELYKGDSPALNCRKIASKMLGVSLDSTYCVMFAFTLGSYKAFCSSSEVHDQYGHYVEVVYDKDADKFYCIHYEESGRTDVLEP